jgi:signal transduction histidine kinase
MIEKQSQGLALLCDLQGLILRVLRNDLGLEKAAAGQLFFSLVDNTSRAKALNFLTELKSQGAVLDWEMNIPSAAGILILHFAGSLAADSLLITAGVSGQIAEHLYEDILSINNEQANLLRAALKDNRELETSRTVSDPMYDEISSLNNELVTMQRELAGKNAELEQRIEERMHELRDAQERLVRHEKLAVLGQMASSIGHELRNPLSIINSSIYYLKLVQPDADVKKHLGIIEQEVRTSDKIITDLLDFARVKSVDCEPVSVSDLIRQTLERFPAPANVEVTLDIPADLPRAYVDVRQMIQVLGNLTVNACQAMKDGGKLSVISRQSSGKAGPLITYNSSLITDHWLLITVCDTGVGIPPENMKKLFEPLFTTKITGIGLGLAVSQKLTEANGGRIEVESEAGVGSTFTVWLPVK